MSQDPGDLLALIPQTTEREIEDQKESIRYLVKCLLTSYPVPLFAVWLWWETDIRILKGS